MQINFNFTIVQKLKKNAVWRPPSGVRCPASGVRRPPSAPGFYVHPAWMHFYKQLCLLTGFFSIFHNILRQWLAPRAHGTFINNDNDVLRLLIFYDLTLLLWHSLVKFVTDWVVYVYTVENNYLCNGDTTKSQRNYEAYNTKPRTKTLAKVQNRVALAVSGVRNSGRKRSKNTGLRQRWSMDGELYSFLL